MAEFTTESKRTRNESKDNKQEMSRTGVRESEKKWRKKALESRGNRFKPKAMMIRRKEIRGGRKASINEVWH